MNLTYFNVKDFFISDNLTIGKNSYSLNLKHDFTNTKINLNSNKKNQLFCLFIIILNLVLKVLKYFFISILFFIHACVRVRVCACVCACDPPSY